VAVMLAKNWSGSDPSGWWMSEKLDGVRAWWNGYTLTTRTGGAIHAPAAFVAGLPVGVTLDGELWLGRGQFQRVVSAFRVERSTDWRHVRYAAFDAPEEPGGFEQRQRALVDVLSGCTGPAFAVAQRQCMGRDDLAQVLAGIVRSGGEGVMLREPGSGYEPCRSASLLKVKPLHDAEAVVVGYRHGSGRNRSTIGALIARLADGRTFGISAGLSDALRLDPPAIGQAVTYSHHGHTAGGLPRFPSFVRLA
jgi:DNA ligase-1